MVKTAAKDRFGGGGNNKRKENKVRRKTPLRLRSRGTKEDMPLGSVLF